MFGVLRPVLSHVSSECKQLYRTTHCNLCASLSASGAGVFNRFFLVHDFVTIDWLLAEEKKSDKHSFACLNCLKGGVIGKTKQIPAHQKLLAAISTFVCGVKINDNAFDSPKLTNKSLVLLYRPFMKKAEALLNEINLLDKLQALIALNQHNETQRVMTIAKACEPTEQSYALLTVEIAKTHSTLPQSTLGLLGRYLGRCVYLLDAIADMDQDRKTNQYNILNILAQSDRSGNAKQNAITKCLRFLKPMRLEITENLGLLYANPSSDRLRKKWESIFISIESQLSTLIKPLNDHCLVSLLSSFSPALTLDFNVPMLDDDRECPIRPSIPGQNQLPGC